NGTLDAADGLSGEDQVFGGVVNLVPHRADLVERLGVEGQRAGLGIPLPRQPTPSGLVQYLAHDEMNGPRPSRHWPWGDLVHSLLAHRVLDEPLGEVLEGNHVALVELVLRVTRRPREEFGVARLPRRHAFAFGREGGLGAG